MEDKGLTNKSITEKLSIWKNNDLNKKAFKGCLTVLQYLQIPGLNATEIHFIDVTASDEPDAEDMCYQNEVLIGVCGSLTDETCYSGSTHSVSVLKMSYGS